MIRAPKSRLSKVRLAMAVTGVPFGVISLIAAIGYCRAVPFPLNIIWGVGWLALLTYHLVLTFRDAEAKAAAKAKAAAHL